MNQSELWTKSFVIISLINFFIVLNFYLLIVIVAPYALQTFHSTLSQAGLAASIFVIGSVIGRLFSGKWIESVGRKKTLIIGTFLSFAMSLVYFDIYNLWVLFAIRLIHGIAYGVAATATGTIVSHIIPKSRRGEGIGYYMLSVTLATAIGPFLGMLLNHHGSFNLIFSVCLISALLSIACALIIFVPEMQLNLEQTEEMKGFKWSNFFESNAIPIAFICAIMYFCYSSILAFLTIYTKEIDLVEAASFFFIVYSVVILVSRPFTGRLFDVRGENITMYPAFISVMLGMILLSQTYHSATLLLAGAFLGFGMGIVQSCGQAIAVKLTPHHRLGLAISTFFIFADIAIGIGPFLLGYLIPFMGYRGVYVAMSIIALLCIFLYYVWHGRKTIPVKHNHVI